MKKLQGGIVGAGKGWIGDVHMSAARLDGEAELVAGAFSSDAAKSRKRGAALGFAPQRVYADYRAMARHEAGKLDFVIVATPNHLHVPVSSAFLRAGFNVVCDKPLAVTLAEAKKLRAVVRKSRRLFALTHNYSAYPMVKQARHFVQRGALGKLIKVVVEYPQGWVAAALAEPAVMKVLKRRWKFRPEFSGASCVLADIGTHAEHLARHITGLETSELCADLAPFVPGNPQENDADVLIRYRGGVRGLLVASQVSTGERNSLNIRVYGEQGGLYWLQEEPERLVVMNLDNTQTVHRRGNASLCAAAKRATRLPGSHPEGFLEAFANIYREFYADIRAKKKRPPGDYPTVDDGVKGLAFVETCLKSAKSNKKWTRMVSYK